MFPLGNLGNVESLPSINILNRFKTIQLQTVIIQRFSFFLVFLDQQGRNVRFSGGGGETLEEFALLPPLVVLEREKKFVR